MMVNEKWSGYNLTHLLPHSEIMSTVTFIMNIANFVLAQTCYTYTIIISKRNKTASSIYTKYFWHGCNQRSTNLGKNHFSAFHMEKQPQIKKKKKRRAIHTVLNN